jgi:predicted dehydrogenase
MARMRAVVVGVGMIGSLHAQVFAEHPATELVAVCDASEERAREVGGRLGARWYTDVEELLAREQVEVATIATPEQARPAAARACARRGINLLLEKPLAPTLAEADELIAEVEAAGVTAGVDFMLRSDPRYARAQQALAGGELGELCTIVARRRLTAVAAEQYARWTDLLITVAIHDLDVMTWLAGPVERVHAEGVVRRTGQWEREDAVLGVLRFAGGAAGSFEASWALPATTPAPLDVSLHVVGTEGGVLIDGAHHGVRVISRDGYDEPDLAHWPVGPMGVEGDLRAHVSRFLEALRTGAPPAGSLAEARYAQQLAEALRESLRARQPVSL